MQQECEVFLRISIVISEDALFKRYFISEDILYQKIFYSDGTFDKREGFREDDAFLNS